MNVSMNCIQARNYIGDSLGNKNHSHSDQGTYMSIKHGSFHFNPIYYEVLPWLMILFIYLGFYVAFNTVQVISRRVVGRAEETSTYSLLGFCTVNC